VSTFGGHAYDGLLIAVEAIKRAKGTDKRRSGTRSSGPRARRHRGVFNMTAEDHMGLSVDAFKLLEVRKAAGSSSTDAARTRRPRAPARSPCSTSCRNSHHRRHRRLDLRAVGLGFAIIYNASTW